MKAWWEGLHTLSSFCMYFLVSKRKNGKKNMRENKSLKFKEGPRGHVCGFLTFLQASDEKTLDTFNNK